MNTNAGLIGRHWCKFNLDGKVRTKIGTSEDRNMSIYHLEAYPFVNIKCEKIIKILI